MLIIYAHNVLNSLQGFLREGNKKHISNIVASKFIQFKFYLVGNLGWVQTQTFSKLQNVKQFWFSVLFIELV